MDLEEGRPYQGCIYDWVEVRTTETEGEKICGTERPSGPMLSQGAEITVVFHSDRVIGRTGYSATVTQGAYQAVIFANLHHNSVFPSF